MGAEIKLPLDRFGFPKTYLHWSWLLFMGVIAFLNITVFVLLLFVHMFVLLHEYSHAFAAKVVGVSCDRITMYPIGGIATIKLNPFDYREEFIVTIVGPLMNFLLCFIFFFLGLLFDGSTQEHLHFFAYINLVLGVFNLLPMYPMDGGRVLRSLLGYCNISTVKRVVISYVTSMAIGGIVLIISLVSLDIWLAFVCSVLMLISMMDYRFTKIYLGECAYMDSEYPDLSLAEKEGVRKLIWERMNS